MRAARVRYAEQDIVNDGDIVTSRRAADLPAIMRELIKLVRRRALKAQAG